MPIIKTKDPLGSPITYHEWNGKRFPAFHLDYDGDITLPNVTSLPARDDDVMILTFPKAGTHWIWEVANMLHTGSGEVSKRNKTDSMLELASLQTLSALPSVRLLNTHLTPEFYPTDLIKRKCKIILVQRNPKDIFVSFFHHTKNLRGYNYDGEWAGFFELLMNGENDYGNWFDWTKNWEQFLTSHPDIPLLRFNFEDMKLDLPSSVEKVGKFLGLPCDRQSAEAVAMQCGFNKMKAAKIVPEPILKRITKGDSHPAFRKGIVGDWKTHFTVAQNERFDVEYKRQMKGYSFGFEQYLN